MAEAQGPIPLRVMEAMIQVVEADTDDDHGYRSDCERFRLACKDWLSAPGQERHAIAKAQYQHAYAAMVALREPLGTRALGNRLGVASRTARLLVEAMRAAGLPVDVQRDGRRLTYRLLGLELTQPKPKKPKAPKPEPNLSLRFGPGLEEHAVPGLPPADPPSQWNVREWTTVGHREGT